MKKLLAMLLCLALCLPAFALAETAETVTIDFGDFTMDMLATDGLQQGVKAEGQVLAIVYPGYDPANNFQHNINAVWTATDMAAVFAALDPAVAAAQLLESGIAALEANGIATANAQLLDAAMVDGNFTMLYSVDADYTALGVALNTTLYQRITYVFAGDKGTYVFTSTTNDQAMLETLAAYMDTVTFK